MAVTSSTDLYEPEIVTDAVRGALKGKLGLMGSVFVSGGAVRVAGNMPERGREAIGKTVRMPYWGILGDFEDLSESQSPTPQKVRQGYEDATVGRASISFETSTWARGSAAASGFEDPYAVLGEEAGNSAQRKMDAAMIAAGATSPLLYNFFNATTPRYVVWGDLVRALSIKMGDESPAMVGMSCHSLVAADLTVQTDANGRQYLADPRANMIADRVVGVPLVMSDRTPLTSSTMGSTFGPYTTKTGTTDGSGSATVALSVTDVSQLGPWEVAIKVATTGEAGTAAIQFSTDGGNTWSEAIATAATTVALPLVDTAADSLVGRNGKTGLSLTVTSASGDDLVAGEYYRATPILCCESQIWMPGAGGFWYNEDALRLKQDEDIQEDTYLGAMHLYYVAHVYRRRNGGARPGVLRIKSNVRNFIGLDWAA
jgi:hypothetical protein